MKYESTNGKFKKGYYSFESGLWFFCYKRPTTQEEINKVNNSRLMLEWVEELPEGSQLF